MVIPPPGFLSPIKRLTVLLPMLFITPLIEPSPINVVELLTDYEGRNSCFVWSFKNRGVIDDYRSFPFAFLFKNMFLFLLMFILIVMFILASTICGGMRWHISSVAIAFALALFPTRLCIGGVAVTRFFESFEATYNPGSIHEEHSEFW